MQIKLVIAVCLILYANGLIAEDLEQGIFTFAGYTDLTFTNSDNQSQTAYKLAPIFLIQPSDRFHLEAEFEFSINDSGESESEIEYLDLHYFATDTITLTVGKVLLPFAHFGPHLHPSWINKLPSQPAIYGGHHGDGLVEGLLPILSDVGIMYQQVLPFSSKHRLYVDAFVSNGPTSSPLHADEGHGDQAAHEEASHDDEAIHDEDEEHHEDGDVEEEHDEEVVHNEDEEHDDGDAGTEDEHDDEEGNLYSTN